MDLGNPYYSTREEASTPAPEVFAAREIVVYKNRWENGIYPAGDRFQDQERPKELKIQ